MATKVIQAQISGHLIIQKSNLPEKVHNMLLEHLTWENPDYRSARQKGMSTRNIPQWIFGMHELGGKVYIAREFYGEVESLCHRYGYTLDIEDLRVVDDNAMPFPHKITLWDSQ